MGFFMRTFWTATLGCKVNQYESRALEEAWEDKGLVRARSSEQADVILINSCAVTARASADARSLARRLRTEAPTARILFTGCGCQVADEELGGLARELDLRLVGQKDKSRLLAGPDPGGEGEAPPLASWSLSGSSRARGVCRVQDGCSHGCAYCIVPLARGPSRSRDPDQAAAEVARLFAAGHREVVVSGVNLRQYGMDLPGRPDFWDLLSAMEARLAPEWAGRTRLRLSSLEPGQLGEKGLETLAVSRLVCPQLHLSLQSGSPATLARMNRSHYDPGEIFGFLDRLLSIWPRFGLGADLLAGFPGESEGEFEETLAFIRRLPLTYAHVFPYSPRPGTRAAAFPDQVSRREAARRAKMLRDAAGEKRTAFVASLVREAPELMVAVERTSPCRGVDQHYVRCCFTDCTDRTRGLLYPARPVGTREGVLLVEEVRR